MSRVRVPWIILSYVLQLLVLLQFCVEALQKVPYFLSDLPQARSVLPRLLKLDISPIYPRAAQSTPPSPSPIRSSPPPPPASRRWMPPPPPCPPYRYSYLCPYTTSPPPPPPLRRSPPSFDAPSSRNSSYSYTAIVALPIVTVVVIFMCSFIRSHNQRAIDTDQGNITTLGTLDDTAALRQVPVTVALGQGNDKGLDHALVNQLPTLLFTAEKSRKGSRKENMYSCAVCISDFEEGDTMRVLPACGHVFHKDCIDMWLFSHSTCPLCRLGLFNNNGDLILQLEHATDSQRAVDPGPSVFAPLDRHVFSPLVNIFRRSQSSIDLSHADRACTRGLAALQRSASHGMESSKVHHTPPLP